MKNEAKETAEAIIGLMILLTWAAFIFVGVALGFWLLS